jgi:hypothetical protein
LGAGGLCFLFIRQRHQKFVFHIVCRDSLPANNHKFFQRTTPTAFSGIAETSTTWENEGWLRRFAGQPGGYSVGLQGVS